jgi:L-alanine-DL-glutamate epimerase-like enolase superfamily enzyme
VRSPIISACASPHISRWKIHLHLSAAYAHEPWVEHFEWLEPMFNERLEIKDGRMIVPNRPGLGFSLSEQAAVWTTDQAEFGRRR